MLTALYCDFPETPVREKKMQSHVIMILHDSIWVEASDEEAEEARKLLERSMKHAVEMPFVPLDVEFD